MVWRFEDHTGEVQLRIDAGSLPELFEQAGQAVAELLAGELERGEAVGPLELTVDAPDLGRLLVDWIDELVFRSEVGHCVLDRFDVRLDGTSVRASARGHRLDRVRTAIKAATLHGLDVRQTGDGWHASVVLDV